MDQQRRLKGKIAIVTGAASGIGEAIALRFTCEGACVVVVDIQDRGLQVVEKVRQQGGKGEFLRVDLSDMAQVEGVIPSTIERFGGLDILVNNAGLYGWMNKKAIGDTPEEVWDKTLDVNLKSAYLLCKAAIPQLIRRGGGSIVNIASIGGIEAFPEFAAYTVSKAGLIALTKSLALDYGRQHIRANAVCPGAIDTPGNDVFIEDRAKYLDIIASLTPLQAPGVPADVASAVVFLASDEARYVTGITLIVDGGRTAQA